jgi:hypothetical protein
MGAVLAVIMVFAFGAASIPLALAAVGAVTAGLVPSPGTSLASSSDRLHVVAMLALFAATILFIMAIVLKSVRSPFLPTAQRLLVGALLAELAFLD